MKRALFALVAGLVLMAVPAVATAQAKTKKKSDDCAEQRKNSKDGQCNLVIDGDDLTGDIIRPGGDDLLARREAVIDGVLFRERVSYVDKLIKTTEQF